VTDSEWRKPSTCSTDRGCVEVRQVPAGSIGIRTSGAPAYPLYVEPQEWREFVAAVKRGEYDYDQGEQ